MPLSVAVVVVDGGSVAVSFKVVSLDVDVGSVVVVEEPESDDDPDVVGKSDDGLDVSGLEVLDGREVKVLLIGVADIVSCFHILSSSDAAASAPSIVPAVSESTIGVRKGIGGLLEAPLELDVLVLALLVVLDELSEVVEE